MPRAPARIRRRYIEGTTEVCPWDVEETLVYGVPLIFGPPCPFCTVGEWRREWSRWGDVILPKCIEHRPGRRPFAMYATGEIPARELIMPLPASNGYWHVDVRHDDGRLVTHWINVPRPFMEPEIVHLRRLGIVDGRELLRCRARHRNAATGKRGRCAVDTYTLEMGLHE